MLGARCDDCSKNNGPMASTTKTDKTYNIYIYIYTVYLTIIYIIYITYLQMNYYRFRACVPIVPILLDGGGFQAAG